MNNQRMLYCGHGRTLKSGSANQSPRAKLPHLLNYYFPKVEDWPSPTEELALMTRESTLALQAWIDMAWKVAGGQPVQCSMSGRCVEKKRSMAKQLRW